VNYILQLYKFKFLQLYKFYNKTFFIELQQTLDWNCIWHWRTTW